jgi:peptidoglycan/LPS O-acetylase OafA/YrhL
VRALGASAVVATHVAFQTGRSTQGPFSGSLSRADIGVALFFVLSGFLLFRPFAQAAVSNRDRWPGTGNYFLRRVLRILPAYWLAVAVALLALRANAGIRGPEVWIRHLTLTQVYSPGLQRTGLTQMWSLCTEAAFYVVLPCLAVLVLGRQGRAAGRRPLTVLALLGAVSVLWAIITSSNVWVPPTAAQWLPGYLDWFAGGMLLALVQVRLLAGTADAWMVRLEELARATWTCWGTAIALFAIATSDVAGPRGLEALPTSWQAVTKNVLYGCCGLLVLLPLVLGPQTSGSPAAILGVRPLRLLGEVSYGIFVWHRLVLEGVIALLHQQLFTGSWLLMFTLTWSASVAVAAVSYVALERPALRLKDRWSGSRCKDPLPVGSVPDQSTTSAATQSA